MARWRWCFMVFYAGGGLRCYNGLDLDVIRHVASITSATKRDDALHQSPPQLKEMTQPLSGLCLHISSLWLRVGLKRWRNPCLTYTCTSHLFGCAPRPCRSDRLESLDLSRQLLGVDGALALAECLPPLLRLSRLALLGCNLPAEVSGLIVHAANIDFPPT